jgi:type VI secretion system secreted protein Hcp
LGEKKCRPAPPRDLGAFAASQEFFMAAVDMFLKLDGIDGESQDEKHKNEIDIKSFSMGVDNGGSGGASKENKARVSDVRVTMLANKASPNLFIACCTGRHIPTAWIYVRKAGEKPLEYETIKLTDVRVSSFSKVGQHGGDLTTENVSLNFAKIEYSYKLQNKDGSAGAPITKAYDVGKNTAS